MPEVRDSGFSVFQKLIQRLQSDADHPQLNRGRAIFQEPLLLLVSIIIYSASFPGLLSSEGFWPAGWFALFPLFLILGRISFMRALIWGALYGLLSYSIAQYWLFTFHPVAIWFVASVQALYMALLFALLNVALRSRVRGKSFAVSALWVAYEYLKTLGFLAYPYGIIGYSQYNNPVMLQGASVAGVLGISFLLIWPQVAAGITLGRFFSDKAFGPSSFFSLIRKKRPGFPVYLILFSLIIVTGNISSRSHGVPGEGRSLRVAMIQNNAGILPPDHVEGRRDRRDPAYRKSINYRSDLETNIRLTTLALEHQPELVVWSETAFIPGIHWYSNGGYGPAKRLVEKLLEFNLESGVPLVTGNSDGRRKDPEGPFSFSNRIDYNSAIFLEKGDISGIYRKQKLVPFTENYPFGAGWPALREFLEEKGDCSFWEKGNANQIFETGGFRFAVPICYEDGFGSLISSMADEGADFFINITNDSWSGSAAAQRQHLALSVFRAVESRTTFLRAAQSGETCLILPTGEVSSRLPAFEQGVLLVEVPPPSGKVSFYRRIGELFGKMSCIIAGLWIILIVIIQIKKWNIRRVRPGER